MVIHSIALFLFVTYLKSQLVFCQYWTNYACCQQPYYVQTGCTYPYSLGYDYYQDWYNLYRSEPTVIVLEELDEDCELIEFLNVISSLQNQPNGPVYVPYPVPIGCDCSDGCSECGCKNTGCGCCNKCGSYDTCDNGCNCNCGCRNQENKCSCNSGNGCSDTNCGCKKNALKHKSCCRS